jgi:hypothetical protein
MNKIRYLSKRNGKGLLLKVAEEKIAVKKLSNRKPWINQEVLDVIDERRKYKNSKTDEKVLRRVGEKRNIMNTLKKKQIYWSHFETK